MIASFTALPTVSRTLGPGAKIVTANPCVCLKSASAVVPWVGKYATMEVAPGIVNVGRIGSTLARHRPG